MQISIGTSIKADVESAVAEVCTKAGTPKFLVLLASFDQFEKASKLVAEKFPNVPMIGTGTISYYETSSSDKRMMLLSFGNDVEVETGVIRNLSTAPMLDIPAMQEKVSKIQAGDSNTICLEFCTNDEERLVTTMNVALERARIPVIGGTVFGYPAGMTPKVLVDGEDIWKNPKEIRKIRSKVGLVFQYPEYQLFESTVQRDIAFGPSAMGLSEEEVSERVKESMELVGMKYDFHCHKVPTVYVSGVVILVQ